MWWEELGLSLSLQTSEELQQFVQEPQQGCEGLLQPPRISSDPEQHQPSHLLAVPSAIEQMASEATLSFLPHRTESLSWQLPSAPSPGTEASLTQPLRPPRGKRDLFALKIGKSSRAGVLVGAHPANPLCQAFGEPDEGYFGVHSVPVQVCVERGGEKAGKGNVLTAPCLFSLLLQRAPENTSCHGDGGLARLGGILPPPSQGHSQRRREKTGGTPKFPIVFFHSFDPKPRPCTCRNPRLSHFSRSG